jgi:hypothetical protein
MRGMLDEAALAAQAWRIMGGMCLARPGILRVAAVWVALVVLAPPAGAVECAVPPGMAPGLEHIDAAERLRFIRTALDTDARRARVWTGSWVGAYVALTAFSLALLPAYDDAHQPDQYVQAGLSVVGALSFAVLPLRVMGDQRWLERRLTRAGPGDHPCAQLADAERLLVRDAASEEEGRGVLIHAGSFVLNVAAGLALGLALGHWDSAALTTFAGAGIGELMILTQPTGAERALARYRAGDLAAPVRVGISPILSGAGGGLRLGVAFGP